MATAVGTFPTGMGWPTTVGGSVVASSTVTVLSQELTTKTRVLSGVTAMLQGHVPDRDGRADDRGGIGRGVEHRDRVVARVGDEGAGAVGREGDGLGRLPDRDGRADDLRGSGRRAP